MQVDPANVPLPTLSTASHTTPHSSMLSPPSPRTQHIIQCMQQEAAALASGSASPPRGRATTREGQELHNALHAMFGLSPVPIPQSPVDQSASPMAAISTSQSRCNKSCRSPPVSSIPTIRRHLLRSCGLNARLVQNTEASTLREMKESLLIIKTTE